MSSSAAQSVSATPLATSAAVATPSSSAPVAASTTSATPTSSSTTSTTPATTPSSSAASSSVINSSSSNTPSSVSSSTNASTNAPSTTTTTSTPPPSSTASSSSSISFILRTSNGQVFTQTAVITLPGSAPTQSQSTQSSTSFFGNKAAVAGVFSTAGVIALIIVFFLLTSFVRRRRARKLDREIEEAAAAAAASAQAPDFDDYDFASGGYGHYSETSHGTFNQPPLSHEQPHNNLGDTPTYEPYGGVGGAVAGAAGIGARGRSVRGGGQADPYGALAHPPEQYEMYETRRSWHQGNPQGGPAIAAYDLLQAAGLAGSDPYAVTRRTSTGLPMLPGQSQPGDSGLNRSQSKGASAALPTTAEIYPTSTPAPGYPGGHDTPYPPEKARYSASFAQEGGISIMPPDTDEDPYSGYNDPPSAALVNPHSPDDVETYAHEDRVEDVVGEHQDGPFLREHEEPARASIADDEDYGYSSGRRVLRVANE